MSFARQLLTCGLPMRIGQRTGLAALLILLGNNGLETAVANGDTRTLSLHHIHTDEDITITYKRNGRYDEEALKRLDRFVRDWRKDEDVHVDPHLFDVIWEVSREIGGGKAIHVVCGYRSPSTNAMLRRRSSGVAQFSQHTLGKAMDFYIPGASLEELRDAGLRLQRGGVGYYPTSGSPFVHLDVGSIRHWPRMTRDQLAHVFPNGRTVHIPSDGHPLPGYALALADIEKRGSSPPSQMSLNAAQAAGVDITATQGAHKKSLFAALFHLDDDEDDANQAAPGVAAPKAPASRAANFKLASVDPRPESVRSVLAPIPVARPQRPAAVLESTVDDVASAPAAVGRNQWAVAGLTEPPRPPSAVPTIPRAPLSHSNTTAGLAPWPIRESDKDRVPLDIVMAYAAQPERDAVSASRATPMESTEEEAVRTTVASAGRVAAARESVIALLKKHFVRTAAAEGGPVVHAKTVVQTASPGMRYDDPWLRAMILAPRLTDSMTATLYGQPDLTELRILMNKPASAVAISFAKEPYPGITADRFSGEAVVLLNTFAFPQRTALLQ